MTVYSATHYNLSRFKEPITKEDYSRYNQILKWFQSNPETKGTISMNSLFIQSHFWENESLIKDISKLCLSGQIDLSSSMYSNYIPLFLDHEEKFLELQVKSAAEILKQIYPNEQVKGYYPPFGVWDERTSKYLTQEGFQYVIMDWYILEKSITDEPKGDIDPGFCKPFKIKGTKLYALPSFDLRSVYRIYPEIYREFLKSGEINVLLKMLEGVANHSQSIDEDFYGILSININDLRFPIYRSDYDFDRYLLESEILAHQPISFTKPSEMIKKTSEIEEIEIKSSYPYEILSLLKGGNEIKLNPCCELYVDRFKEHLIKLNKYHSNLDSVPESTRNIILNLLQYAWKYLITIQHNFCFNITSIPIKGINYLQIAKNWKSIEHLKTVEFIIEELMQRKYNKDKNQLFFIGEEYDEIAYVGENIFSSFLQRGGIICNLVNLAEGEFIASTPSIDLAIDQVSLEPRFGLMYDTVSKRYSGQYSLFNEGYSLSQTQKNGSIELCLASYATGDVILHKCFTLQNNSNKIQVKYKFENCGEKAEEFTLYSLSRFNLADYQTTLTFHDNLIIDDSPRKKNKTMLKLTNTKMKSSLYIELPEEIKWKVVQSFGSLNLTLRIDVPQLSFGEIIEFPFSLIIK